jgi:hypothetical protein
MLDLYLVLITLQINHKQRTGLHDSNMRQCQSAHNGNLSCQRLVNEEKLFQAKKFVGLCRNARNPCHGLVIRHVAYFVRPAGSALSVLASRQLVRTSHFKHPSPGSISHGYIYHRCLATSAPCFKNQPVRRPVSD